MFDLISIGDCVIDTLVPVSDAQIMHQGGQDWLALPFGAKIPVGEGISMVGGNAANNAVGSARLGLKTAIYTNVGNKDDDESDDRIIAKFKKEGVDTRYVIESADLPSNHNIILQYKGDRTILINHQPWKFSLPDLDRSKWIYLTSMSPTYIESNVIDQLINYIERTGAKLAYQPGTFQLKQGSRKQIRLLSLAEFFILNLEEAKHFLGHQSSDSHTVKTLLKNLAELGPKKIVITDGGEGAYGFDGERFFKLEVFPANLVEMTGAGDSYATGTVAGLIQGEPLEKAMRWGACNSASVVEFAGPQAGLLTLSQLEDRLKSNSKITATEL